MSEIFKTIRSRFPVNWLTLVIGWRGVGNRPRAVDLQDVKDFSADMLGRSGDVDCRVADLATISERDEDRVESILAKLAEEGAYPYDDESRKWMVVMLEQELASLPADPLYALLHLTDFWSEFGFPADSPHEVQGKGNNMTPTEYYTQETYDRLLGQHKSWLEREKARLSVRP
ncbi:MAG TPA: DUF2247 family protein, partial [Phycisphaerae bacterium]|nr:DUF2247 family protein [Phycisphaerae bacterium]